MEWDDYVDFRAEHRLSLTEKIAFGLFIFLFIAMTCAMIFDALTPATIVCNDSFTVIHIERAGIFNSKNIVRLQSDVCVIELHVDDREYLEYNVGDTVEGKVAASVFDEYYFYREGENQRYYVSDSIRYN